jgi:hypothetical protein
MRVLVICHPYPNYIPDLLLHGLRHLLGAEAVDWPRKDCLYDGVMGLGICPDNQKFPDLMPPDGDVDRSDIARKVESGYFTMILCDIRAVREHAPLLLKAKSPLALIDGEDKPARVALGNYAILRRETDGSDFSLPLPMALPRQALAWIDRYRDLPKTHSVGFLGSRNHLSPQRNDLLETLAARFPDSLIRATVVPNATDQQPAGRLGRDDYYRSLQGCRVLLNLPGAGYDTFRYWENAACNAAHASARMPLFIPEDFRDGRDIARFDDLSEAVAAIDRLLEHPEMAAEMTAAAREQLLAHHTTERRAAEVLGRLMRTFLLT